MLGEITGGQVCTAGYYYRCAVITLHIWLISLTCPSTSATEGLRTEICELHTFRAQCDVGVVVMTEAFYGRMRKGRCVKRDYGQIGCKSNVISMADRRCSGLKSCEISIPDAEFGRTKPCEGELKTYLEASYECVEVSAPSQPCSGNTVKWLITGQSQGYISNSVAMETQCATRESPMEIRASPGQRINITFHDFNTPYRASTSADFDNNAHTYCNEYFVLYEAIGRKKTKLCPGTERMRHGYMSTNHSLHVYFHRTSNPQHPRRFMIHFEVVGCADLWPGSSMTFRSNHTHAQLACVNSPESWTLQCERGRWTGPRGNCSRGTSEALPEKTNVLNTRLHYGVTIAVILSLALIVGLIFLAAGILCLRRLQKHRNLMPSLHRHDEDVEMKNMEQEVKYCPQHYPRRHTDCHIDAKTRENEANYKVPPVNDYSPMQFHTFRPQTRHDECQEGLLSGEVHIGHPGGCLQHAQGDSLNNVVQCVYSKGRRLPDIDGELTQGVLPCDLTASTLQQRDNTPERNSQDKIFEKPQNYERTLVRKQSFKLNTSF